LTAWPNPKTQRIGKFAFSYSPVREEEKQKHVSKGTWDLTNEASFLKEQKRNCPRFIAVP